jgi:hypothetical protein
MAITYYAYLTDLNGNITLLCKGKNYETIAAKLEAHKNKYAAKHDVWLGGWVQSFK